MEHFKYVNIIRKPNGKLRDWEEYDILSRYEIECNHPIVGRTREVIRTAHLARTIKEKEDERR